MPDPFQYLPDVTERHDDWGEWEAMMASPSTDIIPSAWEALAGRLTPAQREAAMRPGSALVLAGEQNRETDAVLADEPPARASPSRRARISSRSTKGLHPEGPRRRPQDLSQDRRVYGRPGSASSSSTCMKEGAAFRSLMNIFAIAISVGLQYGVPLEIRRRVHVHPLRAGGPRSGQRRDQERNLDPRLCLPRARGLLSWMGRPRARFAGRRRLGAASPRGRRFLSCRFDLPRIRPVSRRDHGSSPGFPGDHDC